MFKTGKILFLAKGLLGSIQLCNQCVYFTSAIHSQKREDSNVLRSIQLCNEWAHFTYNINITLVEGGLNCLGKY